MVLGDPNGPSCHPQGTAGRRLEEQSHGAPRPLVVGDSAVGATALNPSPLPDMPGSLSHFRLACDP